MCLFLLLGKLSFPEVFPASSHFILLARTGSHGPPQLQGKMGNQRPG